MLSFRATQLAPLLLVILILSDIFTSGACFDSTPPCRRSLLALGASDRETNLKSIKQAEAEPTHPESTINRRSFVGAYASISTVFLTGTTWEAAISAETTVETLPNGGTMVEAVDPQTYSSLLYTPPTASFGRGQDEKLPLLVVLHGAGINKEKVWNLANPKGEHAGLPPSLLASGTAPRELSDNFVVVAPYSMGKPSFYQDSRSKILEFINWVCRESPAASMIDPSRIFLLGFSDGATVGVELLTTRRFRGGVICSYGFTGMLPKAAVDRLNNVPMWVFHSADDVIFDVSNSDNLVKSLRPDLVRYMRYNKDPNGFTGSVKGHSTGISASKLPETYTWLLSL